MFEVGQTVKIETSPDLARCRWWPKSGDITGTVQKVYKNGKVMVAVHQLRNRSEDGCHSLNFQPKWLTVIE